MSEREENWTPGPWRVENGAIVAEEVKDGYGAIAFALFTKYTVDDIGNLHVMAQSPAMYAMLKRLEWVDYGNGEWCRICERYCHHAPDCELDALLKSCTGEV